MAKDVGSSQAALPNPFQSALVTPAVNSPIAKPIQNDTSFFHGYRSTFSVDQQKEQYQQHKNQQQEQQQEQQQQLNSQTFNQFHRNAPHRSHHPSNRNASPRTTNSNRTNAAFSSNWCDLCERGFKFPHQLEKHRSEHEKCWYENCTFEGHTQLLKKHLEVQHQSGLFQRIVKVETDEDIEKWREERRKRYPTASNIEARRQAQEQRLKRGERIDEPTHRFGNVNNRKRAQQHRSLASEPNATNNVATKRNDRKSRRRTRHRNKNRLDKKERVECGKNESVTTQNETVTAMASQTEAANCVVVVAAAEKMAQNSSALAAIMGMYGSDSDSHDDDDDGGGAIEIVETIEHKNDENVCLDIDPLDKVKESIAESKPLPALDVTEQNVTVNLKRPADLDDDFPNKQTKIDSDVMENFKQNMAIESDDEAPDEQPIQRQSEAIQDTIDVESGPTETKPMTTSTTSSSQTLTNERISKRKTVLDMTRKIRNQNTLLEKLLQKDIRHERNVLLQCVRYVVEQNFFGIGQTIDEQNSKVNPL